MTLLAGIPVERNSHCTHITVRVVWFDFIKIASRCFLFSLGFLTILRNTYSEMKSKLKISQILSIGIADVGVGRSADGRRSHVIGGVVVATGSTAAYLTRRRVIVDGNEAVLLRVETDGSRAVLGEVGHPPDVRVSRRVVRSVFLQRHVTESVRLIVRQLAIQFPFHAISTIKISLQLVWWIFHLPATMTCWQDSCNLWRLARCRPTCSCWEVEDCSRRWRKSKFPPRRWPHPRRTASNSHRRSPAAAAAAAAVVGDDAAVAVVAVVAESAVASAVGDDDDRDYPPHSDWLPNLTERKLELGPSGSLELPSIDFSTYARFHPQPRPRTATRTTRFLPEPANCCSCSCRIHRSWRTPSQRNLQTSNNHEWPNQPSTGKHWAFYRGLHVGHLAANQVTYHATV